ncbi:MAG: IS21-like element helper ATPase IstB [Myxococcales bacterium]|nr:IS21-like element helper ATPase IstB [Myxococcales bacterium]
MHPTNDLVPILKKLRLSGVLQSLELRSKQAVGDDLTHLEFLYRLLCDEVERREAKQLDLRIRRATFESVTSLEEFDFQFNPLLPKAKILDLATCAFLDRRENVALIGPAGIGKSHIAQALGHRACLAGRSVLYVEARDLFARLRASRADATYERRLKTITAPDLLIIDDLGLTPLRDDEPVDLYEIIRRRYERSSTIVTSNRDIDEWYPLFGDQLLASAALDRFLHHAHVIVAPKGRSHRNPQPDVRGDKP